MTTEEGCCHRSCYMHPTGAAGCLDGSSPLRVLEQLHQLRVQRLVRTYDLALVEHESTAIGIGDDPARFPHHENARRHVPGRKPALPEAIETSCRDPGEIERRCAAAAHARGDSHHLAELA